jgi:hypothetical protein
MINSNNTISKGTIQVKNEEELVNAINNATEPTTITLNKDIKLTRSLDISANKNITLTSHVKRMKN